MRRCTYPSGGNGNSEGANNIRDQLGEQHQLSEEIAQAITSQSVGEQPDEDELDAELEGLELNLTLVRTRSLNTSQSERLYSRDTFFRC